MKKSIYVIIFLSALTGLFVNCSDTNSAQGVTENEIKVGMHTDISGPVSSFGKYSVDGVQMRFDEINQSGGINGRLLTLIAEDHQYQVPRAVQAANKLINKDNIFLMLGSLGTAMNNAVFEMQSEKNIPNLFPLSSARSMVSPLNRLKFGALSTYYDQARAAVKYSVNDQGKDKICVLYQDNDFGQETYEATIDQLTAMDIELTEKATNKPTDTDLTSQINKLRSANCEAIIMGTIVKDTILAYTKARQIGWEDVIIVGQVASYHPVIASQPNGVTDGFLTFAQFPSPDKETCEKHVCDWIERYEAIYGSTPNIGSAYGYMYADIAAKAIEIAGNDLNTDSFIDALESIKDYQLIFGDGILSFGPEKHLGSNDAYLFEVQNGKFVQISDQDISASEQELLIQ